MIEFLALTLAKVATEILTDGLLIYTLVAVIILVAQKCGWQQDEDITKALVISLANYVSFFLDISEKTYLFLSILAATTQFLRKPNSVKEYLRDVRIIFGPVYIVMVLSLLRFIDLSCSINNILSVVVLCCSLLAAIFFRPDNSVMITFLVPIIGNLGYSTRARIHGLLLFTGLVINTLKLMVHGPMHYTIFGIVNILLYVDFKYIKNVGRLTL